MDEKEVIFSFARKKKNLYIYGAGKYGHLCLHIMQTFGINVSGFIETSPSCSSKSNIPVYVASKKIPLLGSDDGIIIATKETYCKEIQMSIPKRLSTLSLSDDVWFKILNDDFFTEMEVLGKKFPCEPLGNPLEWREILIIRLDAIGDMVWTSSFLREIKRNCVRAKITFVLRDEIYPLMRDCPYIDRIICFDCGISSSRKDYSNIEREASLFVEKHMKNENYDAVFLPRVLSTEELENLYLAVCSGAKQRIGRVNATAENIFFSQMQLLFSVVTKARHAEHEVERILDMLRACKLLICEKRMELWHNEIICKKLESVINKKFPVNKKNSIFVAVGLVARDEKRTWPTKQFATFISESAHAYTNVYFILCGGKDAVAAKTKIMDVVDKEKCLDFVGEMTLDETTALLKECDFYLGVNTGLLHMAAAVGKPVVEISGQWEGGNDDSGLSPLRVGAYGVTSITIRPKGPADAECAEAGYCKKKYAHCISQISVNDVKNAMESMIQMICK